MNRKKFREILNKKILITDGAMGSELIKRIPQKELITSEIANLKFEKILLDIHSEYLAAGSDIILTNTFGANRIKLSCWKIDNKIEEINKNAVKTAKLAVKMSKKNALVAGNLAPTGKFVCPIGPLSFEEVYNTYFEQAALLNRSGVDLLLLETFSDLKEAKIAAIAARDAFNGPIILSMTFSEDNRTLSGTDPITFAICCNSLDIDAIGINCGVGSKKMHELIQILLGYSSKPVLVEPNAGIPYIENDKTIYPETIEEFVVNIKRMVDVGVNIVGGCCGTTPDFIKEIYLSVSDRFPVLSERPKIFGIASRTKAVFPEDQFLLIGERINPTARKTLAKEIALLKIDEIQKEAKNQVDKGALALDINVGIGGEIEIPAMRKAVNAIQSATDIPVVLDSTSWKVLEAGLKEAVGKPVINSVTAKEKDLDEILPLAKKYGAAIICLPIDDNGIAYNINDRLKLTEKIIARAQKIGIQKEDIIIDGLVLSIVSHQEFVMDTLKFISCVKKKFGVKTILGISNISHGLPRRPLLNSIYLAMAIGHGLDCAIINPCDEEINKVLMCAEVFRNIDKKASLFIEKVSDMNENIRNLPKLATPQEEVFSAILLGNKEGVVGYLAKCMEAGESPIDLINKHIIPAMQEVGRLFKAKKYYLPQVLMSADALAESFDYLKPFVGKEKFLNKGTVIIATVRGDIHDVGKNIVSVVLQSNGFNVIDLGVDVPYDKILKSAMEENADIIGLSALMTTTLKSMEDCVQSIKSCHKCKSLVIVGGAVVNRSFASKIGADGYAPDAISAVDLIENLLSLAKK